MRANLLQRTTKSVLGIAFITVFGIAFAEDNSEADEPCDKNQMTMNDCAAQKFHSADAELNVLYQKQLSYIEHKKTKALLQDAQRAWIVFRDKDCWYQRGPEEDQGSMDAMIMFSCMYDRTKSRIEELQKYIECRQNGCPY